MQEKFSKKIEDAMHSIDGIKKASPPLYFFTRLEARMQREKNFWEKISSFVARPSITIACIILILIMNLGVILSSSKTDQMIAQKNEPPTVVEEYSQLSANLYEFENMKP